MLKSPEYWKNIKLSDNEFFAFSNREEYFFFISEYFFLNEWFAVNSWNTSMGELQDIRKFCKFMPLTSCF